MNKKIIAFGNPVYDRIMTPDITRQDRVLSGCSTNACLALSHLGEISTLIGTVGPDFKEKIVTDLVKYGISYDLFPSCETGGFSLIYDNKGDRELKVLGHADPIPSVLNLDESFDFVLLGPILNEINIDLAKKIKDKYNTPILLDPQGLLRYIEDGEIMHHVSESYKKISAISTIVKANEIETQTITGVVPRQDPELAVKKLYECGCKIAITTLAEAGSIIFNGENYYHIPPFSTHAVDPTGAGDTYAAGFMTRYLEIPDDLYSVGCFASSVSSIMVENSGPDFEMTRKEVDRRSEILCRSKSGIKL